MLQPLLKASLTRICLMAESSRIQPGLRLWGWLLSWVPGGKGQGFAAARVWRAPSFQGIHSLHGLPCPGNWEVFCCPEGL